MNAFRLLRPGARAWTAAGGWAALVLALSLLPIAGPSPQTETLLLDKVVHAGLYFVLGFLLARALMAARRKRPLLVWAMSVAMAVAFGAVIELLQGLIGRDTQAGDVVADLLGAVPGAALFVLALGRGASSTK